MQNKLLLETYRRNAVAVITQILTNSGVMAVAANGVLDSKAPVEILAMEAPIGAAVLMWDLYLGHLTTGVEPIGWLRFEFGPIMDVRTNLKALEGIEATVHQYWMGLPKAPAVAKDTIHFTTWKPGNQHAN